VNSNYESPSNVLENLIQFSDKNLNDVKEKEIFVNLLNNDILKKKENKKNSAKFNTTTSSDNFYSFDFKQFLKFMKTRELEFSNKELELSSLKNEIAYLKKDAEIKNNSKKSYDLKQETDSELKSKIRELESQLNSAILNNSKLERENGILKNELVNHKKNKNFILKRFNEEIFDMTKLTKEFFDNFVAIEN
jgi:hypothetical protein